MKNLKNMGAHRIIRAYFFVVILGSIAIMKLGIEWLGLWVFLLTLVSITLLLLVHFGDVGSTWKDKE